MTRPGRELLCASKLVVVQPVCQPRTAVDMDCKLAEGNRPFAGAKGLGPCLVPFVLPNRLALSPHG